MDLGKIMARGAQGCGAEDAGGAVEVGASEDLASLLLLPLSGAVADMEPPLTIAVDGVGPSDDAVSLCAPVADGAALLLRSQGSHASPRAMPVGGPVPPRPPGPAVAT